MNNEKKNIEVVESICNLLDELAPSKPGNIKSYNELITFVEDRPGHDQRYAIDTTKIKNELGWEPKIDVEQLCKIMVESDIIRNKNNASF